MGNYDHMGFTMHGALNMVPYDPVYALFEATMFENGDSGQSYWVTSDADDPDFSDLVAFLTDGSDNLWVVRHSLPLGGSSGGYIYPESIVFGGDPGTDALGRWNITGFELVINSLSIASPGSDPNNDGDWTDAGFNVTFNVYGTAVPEPATLTLLGFGMLVLAATRKKLSCGCESTPRSLRYR